MDDCIFCQIVRKETQSYIIHEDDDFIVFLDRFPSTLGHLLIIPKEHFATIFDMNDDLAKKLFPLVVKFSKVLEQTLDINGLNVIQNNYEHGGQTIDHFHVHIIPRYIDDKVKFSWELENPDHGEFEELIKKLKENM